MSISLIFTPIIRFSHSNRGAFRHRPKGLHCQYV